MSEQYINPWTGHYRNRPYRGTTPTQIRNLIIAQFGAIALTWSYEKIKKIYNKYSNMGIFQRKRGVVTNINIGRLSSRIKRLEQGYDKEMKTYDDTRSGALPNTGAGEINCISDMAQGDTSITREGLVIQPRHLEYKFVCLANSATLYQARVIIFVDTHQSGVAPTATELLETDASTSWIHHDTRPRFRILRDFWMVPDTATKGAIVRRGIIKFGKKFRIHYQGTGTGASSMGKNNIYLYCISNTATGAPSFNIYTRLRFVDG